MTQKTVKEAATLAIILSSDVFYYEDGGTKVECWFGENLEELEVTGQMMMEVSYIIYRLEAHYEHYMKTKGEIYD